jgi:hypothetical protein
MDFEQKLDMILFEDVVNENILGLIAKGLWGTAKALFSVAVDIATPITSLGLRGLAKLANVVARDLEQDELPPKSEIFEKIDRWVRKYAIPSDAAEKMKAEVGVAYKYA